METELYFELNTNKDMRQEIQCLSCVQGKAI